MLYCVCGAETAPALERSMKMAVLKGLKPEKVFAYFEKLCSVPHGSGNTKIISDLCVSFAEELGLKYRQEPCNNVVIWKPASPGCESAEPIILQGHIDMVCAKTDDCTKDMTREGLDLRTDGQWVWADKTSLGGDNCIAVAMILAVLADDDLPHPPIEAVFTVDEEVGMDGAAALDCSDLKGRRLLNLDSEQEGVFTVSCAGGMRMDCVLPAEQTAVSGGDCFALTISGLQGGQFDNVICSRCEAAVVLPRGGADFAAFVREFDGILKNEYAVTDPGVSLECAPVQVSDAVNEADTVKLLRTLLALPQGVEAMDTDFPGLVQTSLNMGVVMLTSGGLHVTFSVRSSVASRKEMLAQRVRAITEMAGGTVSERGVYPGWQYDRNSQFRPMVLAAYKDMTGRDGVVEATHGGLECGLLMEKISGVDAVSMGPNILDIHSVRERLDVASTARVYDTLCEVLRRSK